jgi:hypothetical protein
MSDSFSTADIGLAKKKKRKRKKMEGRGRDGRQKAESGCSMCGILRI